jgi:quinol monooxygenase YgiN
LLPILNQTRVTAHKQHIPAKMTLAQAMKEHEDNLRRQVTALNVPVTEVVIFKLLCDATEDALNSIRKDFVLNSATGDGLLRLSWGQSHDDPKAILMFLDWRRIQDHWRFWQQPEFETVFACITKWFEPGPPVVHHYVFDPPGMIDAEFVRVLIWDGGVASLPTDVIERVCEKDNDVEIVRAGFAVDPGAATRCCVLLGYHSEETARAHQFTRKEHTHLVIPEFINGSAWSLGRGQETTS